MNTGIEILLKRIQDCPDDFQYNINTDTSSRWNKLLMEALRSDVITEEEKSALKHEVTEMGRARFTERVMRELAGVEDETSEQGKSPYLVQGTLSAGQTLGHSNTGLGYQALSQATTGQFNTVIGNSAFQQALQAQMEQMKLHLDAHREAMKQEESAKRWWKKTIPELLGKK